jgi:signal transduction histidine kinase
MMRARARATKLPRMVDSAPEQNLRLVRSDEDAAGEAQTGTRTPPVLSFGGKRWRLIEVDDIDDAVAAVVFDPELAADNGFSRIVTAAAEMASERHRMEAELLSSRRRAIAAADRERQRIERNLHDGAQQMLVALRVKLGEAHDAILDECPHGARMLDELDADLETAIDDLRLLAHGLHPHLLGDVGLPGALRAQARRATVPTTVSAKRIGRYHAELETAVHYCCHEALQNACRHARASVAIRLWSEDSVLRFEVADTGPGFDPSAQFPGIGLQNMRDRIAAIGGILWIDSFPGRGTTVSGAVPARELAQ